MLLGQKANTVLKFDEYVPQDKQRELHKSPANDILFGGAAGPGKSHSLRHLGAMWCSRIKGLQVYLFRRTNPELEKTHTIKSQAEFPQHLGKWSEGKKRWNWFNGSMYHFCHCQYEKDVFNYQGAEIHVLIIDEVTTFTPFQLDYLTGRVRCEMEVEPKFRHKIPLIACAGNPGGVGHQYCKNRWVDFAPEFEVKKAPPDEGGMNRQYIPGKLQDNPILMKNDPGYINRLKALPEPYRTAYLEGDWNLFIGQAFNFNYKHHVVKPEDYPIPADAPLLFTFDWGYSAPYSCGWWWVDGEGRLYRFAELYGADTNMANAGLRHEDSVIADHIIMVEDFHGIRDRTITRLCDPTCFNKKPLDSGPSTAEEFAKKGIIMQRGDPNRKSKIRQFRERLKVDKRLIDDDGNLLELPMMVVYNTCVDFIRTIPTLIMDPLNNEDIDTTAEDHNYDEACHAVMARATGRKVLDGSEMVARAGMRGGGTV